MGARPKTGEPKSALTKRQLVFLQRAARPEGVVSREFTEQTVRGVVMRGFVRMSFRAGLKAGGGVAQVYVASDKGREYLATYRKVEPTVNAVHLSRADAIIWSRQMRAALEALRNECRRVEQLLDAAVIAAADAALAQSAKVGLARLSQKGATHG